MPSPQSIFEHSALIAILVLSLLVAAISSARAEVVTGMYHSTSGGQTTIWVHTDANNWYTTTSSDPSFAGFETELIMSWQTNGNINVGANGSYITSLSVSSGY